VCVCERERERDIGEDNAVVFFCCFAVGALLMKMWF
jgi:hypothetical protein